MENLVETMKVMNLLKTTFAYIERDRTEEQLAQMFDVYAQLLDDLDPDMLKAAAMQVITESKFFPTIAELREKAIGMIERANETPDHSQAWDEMMHEVHRVGYMSWAETQFSTPLIREVVKIYWHDACLSPEENLPTIRAQFRDTYNARARRKAEDLRMLPATRNMIKALADRLDMGKRLLAAAGEGGHGNDSE